MTKKSLFRTIAVLVAAALYVGLDQWTKALAARYLPDVPFVLIPGLFELHYSTNTGAAFGLGAGGRWLLVALTLAILAVIVWVFVTGKLRGVWATIGGTLVLAGGVGNLIDRAFVGRVTDFLYFKLIDFPIFNVADCGVVVGAIMLLIYFLFLYKEAPRGTADTEPPAGPAAG